MTTGPASRGCSPAQEVSALGGRLKTLEARLAEIEMVIGRLEGAALTTARALQEISSHWDAVYDALRRAEVAPSRD
jgi:uncharacterized coiled-coil protein SlyX